jgi:thiol:disulfide interchange protein DsbD
VCAQPTPVKWSIKSTSPDKTLNAGVKFTVQVTALIEQGWHIYSLTQPEGGPLSTKITIPDRQPFKLAGRIEGPQPISKLEEVIGVTEWHEKVADFSLPVQIEPDASAGKCKLLVEVRFQACSKQICLPPTTAKLELEVELVATEKMNRSAQAPAGSANAQDRSRLSMVGRNGPSDSEVPEFSFTDFDGKAHKFSEFHGRVVLLDFWATWCKPCLADIPHLKELYAKYRAQGFEIIGMDSETLGQDEETPDPEFAKQRDERARQIVTTRGASWVHATAETAVPVAMRVFDVKLLPAKILIDEQGKIVARVEETKSLDSLLEKMFRAK